MLLREDLLCDRAIALAGPPPGTVSGALTSLGARIEALPIGEESELEAWARERAPLHGLVYDARSAFAGGGEVPLQGAIEQAWGAVRAVAVGALVESDGPAKVVLVAPRSDAGPLAGAAAAALENLARTLSVEWARYAITATAIVPGAAAGDEELAELVCFLVSSAGDYFSGCRFDLA
jgi:NAD(P)-dependent dehydrogenase (short-subunit alcohol dehydrogenase family)